jgi:hypothetical protein
MRLVTSGLALIVAGLMVSAARADQKQACSDAYQQAQILREQHKLVASREQLRVCAEASCPGFITKDCTQWLKEIDPRVPSVVLTAKNASGADVTDVKVTVDGAPLVTKLDGLAVDVDPGQHTFHFEGAEGAAEQKVLVPEGTKAQRVAVALGAARMVGDVAPPSAAIGSSSTASSSAEPAQNGLSFGARIGYALPIGSLVSGTSLGNNVSGHLPLWLDAGYLFIPQLYVGAYLAYGVGFPANCTGECSANVVRLGVDAQYRFLPAGRIDPWAGIGLGYEILNGSFPYDGALYALSFSGFEFFNLQGGVDFKVLPNLGVGPFLAFSLGEYANISASQNGIPDNGLFIEEKAVHGWFYLGIRAQYDLHL